MHICEFIILKNLCGKKKNKPGSYVLYNKCYTSCMNTPCVYGCSRARISFPNPTVPPELSSIRVKGKHPICIYKAQSVNTSGRQL